MENIIADLKTDNAQLEESFNVKNVELQRLQQLHGVLLDKQIQQKQHTPNIKTTDVHPIRKPSVTEKSTPRNTEIDFCAQKWYEGACKQPNCNLNHNINLETLKNGICFNEYFKKGSCRSQQNCRYNHNIPCAVRKDPNIKTHIDNKLQKWREAKGITNKTPPNKHHSAPTINTANYLPTLMNPNTTNVVPQTKSSPLAHMNTQEMNFDTSTVPPTPTTSQAYTNTQNYDRLMPTVFPSPTTTAPTFTYQDQNPLYTNLQSTNEVPDIAINNPAQIAFLGQLIHSIVYQALNNYAPPINMN